MKFSFLLKPLDPFNAHGHIDQRLQKNTAEWPNITLQEEISKKWYITLTLELNLTS